MTSYNRKTLKLRCPLGMRNKVCVAVSVDVTGAGIAPSGAFDLISIAEAACATLVSVLLR